MTESLPYRSFSQYCRETYGKKIYKVPIHLKGSCPNRDGTKGRGGCIFCGEEGGSFEWTYGGVREQFRENKERMKKRYHAEGFIAYFQNFTGTYLPLEEFERNLRAIRDEDIVAVSISTRPDCVEKEYLDVAESIFGTERVSFELGLQSASDETLAILNRGHTVEEFIDGARRIKDRGFRLSTHMILDLPWDTDEDIVEGAHLLNEVSSDEVKIHNLYVPKRTKLAEMYRDEIFEPISMQAFMTRVMLFLEHLSPDMVIGRLLGRAPEKDVLFANWNRSWYFIRDEIVRQMKEQNKRQGRLFEDKKGRE
ncbi:MAG: TIGR01212 family radical SAM protein [Peptoniphilus sp.]|nr:TIGR01212 family radical SAM protein [Peptoniphilus sp.]MDD7363737.1 TIGR01212 family radical SAM protein [Bacillota bacterium]MDY6044122.1 TIGR01212 family radical SAM protein [Peptoniphilus sp.]